MNTGQSIPDMTLSSDMFKSCSRMFNHFSLGMTLFPSSEVIKDWLVKPLRDQHVKPKAKATFKCELFKDTPNWKWLKGENELSPSDKVEINKDGKDMTLTINNCQPDDVSDYTIEVEDRRYTAKLTLGGGFTKIHN